MSNNTTIFERIAINLFTPFEVLLSFLYERRDFRWICRRVVAHKTMLYEMMIFTYTQEGESSYFRELKYSPCGMLCYIVGRNKGHFSCRNGLPFQGRTEKLPIRRKRQ